ncbi:MAG: MerR family DNA-binding transcriptional regulator [Myxococcales bacterium]|nr:MerR family DNA-binding transcriptional regulator [Myxococcales bacterium]
MLGELLVADVAKILGVSTKTLRRWDRDGTLPALRDARNGYRRYARAAVARFAAARGLEEGVSALAAFPVSREALLETLTNLLSTRRGAVLVGPPGAGKTSLAHLTARGFGERLVLRRPTSVDLHSAIERHHGVVVADDVLDPRELTESLAPRLETSSARLLVTTRRDLGAVEGLSTVPVTYLAYDESLLLLRSIAPSAPLANHAALARELAGYLPWLESAGRVLAVDPHYDVRALTHAILRAPEAIRDVLGEHPPASRGSSHPPRALPDAAVRNALDELPVAVRETLLALSTVRGVFSLRDAAHVLGRTVASTHQMLGALCEWSLVTRIELRYRIPEPVRLVAESQPSGTPSVDAYDSRDTARRRADALIVEALAAHRERIEPADVDELVGVLERGFVAPARPLRAIPPWAIRSRHVAPLRRLQAAGVPLETTIEVELTVFEGALSRAEDLLAHSATTDPLEPRAKAERSLQSAYVLRRRGRLDDASRVLTDMLEHDLADDLRARALSELGATIYLGGSVREARSRLREAEVLATRDDLGSLQGVISTNLANVLGDLGEVDEARRAAERALALAVDTRGRAIACANLARLDLEVGDLGAARTAIELAEASEVFTSDAGFRSYVERLKGWLAFAVGEHAEASRMFALAGETALDHGERHAAARAHLEHALCVMVEAPGRACVLVDEAKRLGPPSSLLAALVRASSTLRYAEAAEAASAEPIDAYANPVTLDERCAVILSMLYATAGDPAGQIASLRRADRSAMTRAALAIVRRFAPTRLDFLAIRRDGGEALVSGQLIDLQTRPTVARFLQVLATAGEAGLSGAALLARVWPDEVLAPRRTMHRVHNGCSTLRRLGLPIACDHGVFRVVGHVRWYEARPHLA